MRIRACGIHNGRAAVHLVNDVIANLLRVRGDNGEIFAEVNTFNHGIDHERLDSKTEQRKQACADIEYKHRGKRDERIADEQRFADIKTRVLFEDHRNNIRAAARSVAVKEDRRADRRQHHTVAQLEERLVGKRLGKRNELFKQPRQKRKQHATIHGKHTETASQNDKTDDEQDDIDNPHDTRCGERRKNMTEQNRDTAHAAGGKIIRKFKEISADGKNKGAERDEHKRL